MKSKVKTAFAEFKITTIRLMEELKTEGNQPENYLDLWNKHVKTADWYDEDKECLVVFTLTTQLKVKGFHLISLGSVNETVAKVCDILKPVIISSAPNFVLAHNHPSGETLPSQADKDVTRKVRDAASIMGVNLIDHIITGDGFFSFRQSGLI